MHNLLVIEAIPSQHILTPLDDFKAIPALSRHPHEEISLLVADAAIASCNTLDLGQLHLVCECAAVAAAAVGVKVGHDGTSWYVVAVVVVRRCSTGMVAGTFEKSSVSL